MKGKLIVISILTIALIVSLITVTLAWYTQQDTVFSSPVTVTTASVIEISLSATDFKDLSEDYYGQTGIGVPGGDEEDDQDVPYYTLFKNIAINSPNNVKLTFTVSECKVYQTFNGGIDYWEPISHATAEAYAETYSKTIEQYFEDITAAKNNFVYVCNETELANDFALFIYEQDQDIMADAVSTYGDGTAQYNQYIEDHPAYDIDLDDPVFRNADGDTDSDPTVDNALLNNETKIYTIRVRFWGGNADEAFPLSREAFSGSQFNIKIKVEACEVME